MPAARRPGAALAHDMIERSGVEQSLAGNEALLRNILNSAMDAIVTVDNRQHIVLFNAAAEAMFACGRQQAIGAPIGRFIPVRLHPLHGEQIQRMGRQEDHLHRAGALRITTGLRFNREEFPIEGSISQVCEHGRKFYTFILRDISGSVQAAEALRRSKEQLHEFASAAHSVREQEKSRIARELHDELGQALTALKIDIAWLAARLPERKEGVGAKLDAMSNLLDGMVTATRRIATDLRPLMLDDLGLIPATEWLVQSFGQRTGIACRLEVGDLGAEQGLQEPYATAVFRIVQESLNNVAKHASASHVKVSLMQNGGSVLVQVQDDGVGFVLPTVRKPQSYGLLGVRERAYLLGGVASIESAPGRGTSIKVCIPLSAAVGAAVAAPESRP
jgi:PAS domain S-box-containing protein